MLAGLPFSAAGASVGRPAYDHRPPTSPEMPPMGADRVFRPVFGSDEQMFGGEQQVLHSE